MDEMRFGMADLLESDLADDEDALAYLLDYGTKRVGATSQEQFNGWLRSAYRTAMGHMKGRSTGSPAKDVAYVLRLMESLDAGTKG